jgi:hypothetical protein
VKDITDCADYAEIDSEWEKGQKQFKMLMLKLATRQKAGDMRMSYSGLREIIEALELNEFILENTEGSKSA